jgi:hypothetical protein
MRAKRPLQPWDRSVIVRETVTHGALLVIVLASGMGFFGLLLVLVGQAMIAVIPFSIEKRAQGLLSILGGLLGALVFAAFLMLMTAAWYGASIGELQDDEMLGFTLILEADPGVLLPWGIAFLAIQITVLGIHRWTRPLPARSVAMVARAQFTITFLVLLGIMFLKSVMMFLPDGGVFVWRIVNLILPWLRLDECVAVVTVSGRLVIALFASRDPEFKGTSQPASTA